MTRNPNSNRPNSRAGNGSTARRRQASRASGTPGRARRRQGSYARQATGQRHSGRLRATGSHGASTAGRSTATRRAPQSALDKKALTIPIDNNEILITRRQLLYGAIGVGVLAAVGTGAKAVSDMLTPQEDIDILSVPSNRLTTSNDLDEAQYANYLYLYAKASMPYGTMVFANDPAYAACLIPTDQASPLTKIGVLSLSSGNYSTVISKAQGSSEGYEIYDVRLNGSGIVWTEANVLADTWRIYTAKLDGFEVSSIQLVEEGGSGWETPTIATAGNYAFWQVLPLADGPYSKQQSLLKKAAFGSSDASTVYASTGRMATPIYALEDQVVITPRANTSTINYQLTLIDAESSEVLDKITLPSSMKPLEAGYGNNGFLFSFEAIYSYGDGISNLGSYTPTSKAEGAQLSEVSWFNFVRTPSAAPAWCGNCFCVKSTTAVCGVDLENKCYFALDVPSGAGDYGDYLASTGTGSSLVTYCNVDYTAADGSGDTAYETTVRIWRAY